MKSLLLLLIEDSEDDAMLLVRESERRYSALFANKIIGIAHCRVITDERGQPVTIIGKNMGGKLTVRNGVEGAEFRIEVCDGIRI